jgi:hypothetical protein
MTWRAVRTVAKVIAVLVFLAYMLLVTFAEVIVPALR